MEHNLTVLICCAVIFSGLRLQMSGLKAIEVLCSFYWQINKLTWILTSISSYLPSLKFLVPELLCKFLICCNFSHNDTVFQQSQKSSFSAGRCTFLQHLTATVWKLYDCIDFSMHIYCRNGLLFNVSIYENSDGTTVISGQIPSTE